MDSFLAFSILSSSPADIAAGGGYYSTRLSWRTCGAKQQQAEKKALPKQDNKAEEKRQGAPRPVPERKKQEARPRFAPEFDGLHCFESIVSL